jgi:hypothetical protein
VYRCSPASKRRAESAARELANMSRDELGHLEHAHLALAVEYGPERVVRVNHSSLGPVLKSVLLDVVPELFRELGTWQRFGTDDGGEFVIGLNRSHEGGIRLAF